MRYMWTVLVALMALLSVSKANAAIPVWEKGVLTGITVESGEHCWFAFQTMRKHGVDVTWGQVQASKGCKTLMQPGDTIQVPKQALYVVSKPAAGTSVDSVGETGSARADSVAPEMRAGTARGGEKRKVETGPTSHVAPEEVCDPTCQLNRAVLARIAGDQVETGSAHADHVAPVETLSVSKKREIVRTTLVAHSYCTSDQVVELHRRLTLATVERNDLIGCGARVLEESLARTSTILYAKLARRNQPQWEPYPVSCQYGGEGSCYKRQL